MKILLCMLSVLYVSSFIIKNKQPGKYENNKYFHLFYLIRFFNRFQNN